ncbi:nucleolus and neural progenitor protein isoform X2 [Denticeps clupeoides]|nr:nucleolus and neural progenitor protein isoform X2 [Denticeps clupeoides]
MNKPFRQHSPFRTMKQVEQAVNRLKEMRLMAAVQDLWDLCPKQAQRTVGLQCGTCEVPSQPVLEWVCLKVLGGARLLGRLVDQCSTTFILSKRHLQSGEFIVLNMVLTSMMSRLWVFFRGLLSGLVPVYQRAVDLRQVVAQVQPMPYLTEFSLPEDLLGFLGPSAAALLEKELPLEVLKSYASESKLLYKLFGQEGEDQSKEQKRMGEMKPTTGQTLEDVGRRVQRKTGLMHKVTLTPSEANVQTAAELPSWRVSKKLLFSPDPAVVGQQKELQKRLRAAPSCSSMAGELQQAIQWCRSRNLRQKKRRLAFLYLTCQSLAGLEAEGFSVKRRFQRFRLRVERALMQRKAKAVDFGPRWCRNRWCKMSRRALHGTSSWKKRRTRRLETSEKGCAATRPRFWKDGSSPGQSAGERGGGLPEESTAGGTDVRKSDKSQTLEKLAGDDIDDIFSSICS